MCGSMVDIQCPTAEIRRGNKKEERRNHMMKIYYFGILLCRAAINYYRPPLQVLALTLSFLYSFRHYDKRIGYHIPALANWATYYDPGFPYTNIRCRCYKPTAHCNKSASIVNIAQH